MCWTRFLKTILDQDSGTNFLNTFLGHVFWTAETERSQNLKIEPQSRHTKPCRKHNRPSITTKKTRQTHSLSLTPEDPVSHPLVSTHHLLLFVFCFCLPLRGLQMPKNLSPHLLLFETTAVPGVCVAHHNNCLLKRATSIACPASPTLLKIGVESKARKPIAGLINLQCPLHFERVWKGYIAYREQWRDLVKQQVSFQLAVAQVDEQRQSDQLQDQSVPEESLVQNFSEPNRRPVSHPLVSTHLFSYLYSVFACPFVGCKCPKIYLPTCCYLEQQPCLVFTLHITIIVC